MSDPLLSVSKLSKTFGGVVAVDMLDLQVFAGQRVGIIGPNGSGKTTLTNCIAGRLLPTSGTITFAGKTITRVPAHGRARLGIGRTFQLPLPFHSLTLAENLMVPLEFCGGRVDDMKERISSTLQLLGLQHAASAYAGSLTQVDLRKLELARAIVSSPRLLIADETMAGLSTSEVDEMLAVLDRLSAQGITIILIEHIMRAIMAFSERIVCLDAGRKIADDSPQAVMSLPQVEKAYLGE